MELELTPQASASENAPQVVVGGAGQFQPSPRQRALLDSLRARDLLLSRMYEGALIVLTRHDNPERHAQCAHSLRELMEKLPEHIDLEQRGVAQDQDGTPSLRGAANLNGMVQELKLDWDKKSTKSSCFKDGHWEGEIDGVLRKQLKRLDSFFVRVGEARPTRAKLARGAVRRIDLSQRRPPQRIEELQVEVWKEIWDYFQAVSHHNEASAAEFDSYVAELESFLLDRMRPSTYEDIKEITSLIDEAEGR